MKAKTTPIHRTGVVHPTQRTYRATRNEALFRKKRTSDHALLSLLPCNGHRVASIHKRPESLGVIPHKQKWTSIVNTFEDVGVEVTVELHVRLGTQAG